MGTIIDLLREADHWCGERGASLVRAEDVDAAVAADDRRGGRVRERMLEQIITGTQLIQTQGAVVGQINGLSVLQLGRASFGRPTRITARVRLGRGEVVDIEHEVELGGPIHSKGVLILAGFLGPRYAKEHPLALSATSSSLASPPAPAAKAARSPKGASTPASRNGWWRWPSCAPTPARRARTPAERRSRELQGGEQGGEQAEGGGEQKQKAG